MSAVWQVLLKPVRFQLAIMQEAFMVKIMSVVLQAELQTVTMLEILIIPVKLK